MNSEGDEPAVGEIPDFHGYRAMAGWMQEIAPYGIFTTDRELRITSWNHWMLIHSGVSPEHVVGRLLTDIVPDLNERRVKERYTRALAGEISVLSTALHKYLLPLRVTVADSGLEHMLQTARVAPLRDKGVVVGTITVIEDVTQREVQATILRRQQELDRLLSTSLAALLQADEPAQEIGAIFANISPALGLDAYACYLLAPDGRTLRLHIASGISPRQRETIASVPVLTAEQRNLDNGAVGNVAELASHAEALRGLGLRGQCSFPLAVGNRLLGLVSFGSYQRETIAPGDVNVLSRIARYVSIALDRAQREHETLAASRAKDDFLAALSHELRTPLNPVLLLASDGACNPDFSPGARETFRVIEKNALLEARLIDDLLDLTRIEHGKLGLELQSLDIHSALRDALATIASEAAERNQSVHVELGAQARTVEGDSGRLQQVFWNLLKNAVKFTPIGGKIDVTSTSNPAGSEVTITISDTGIGMDPHELKRVFNAFSQGDHADNRQSHRFGGLGLGLAISRKLVELHSGRIEAASAGKNCGATFTVNLPATADSMANTRKTIEAHRGTETLDANRTPGSRAHILLIEDHEPTRIPLTRLLVKKGYRVVAVASGADALEAVSKQQFDLVLSDIGLPDINGFTLMQNLRERYGLKGIALTGYGMEADISRGTDAGFVAHLTKPVSLRVLERALAIALPGQIGAENATSAPQL